MWVWEVSSVLYYEKHLNILVLWRLQRLQKVAKSDFQALKVSRLREVQRWQSGLQKLQSPNLNI